MISYKGNMTNDGGSVDLKTKQELSSICLQMSQMMFFTFPLSTYLTKVV